MQIYSDRTAASSKLNALISHPAHFLWLNFTKRKRRFLVDHRYNLVKVLQVAIAEPGKEYADCEADSGAFVYGAYIIHCGSFE